jgi:hypothetical protein
MTAWRFLHEQMLYPYHLLRVLGLKPEDCPTRQTSCRLSVQQCAGSPFLLSVLFSDETGSVETGIINFYNHHQWGETNSHSVLQSRHQH